MTEQELKVKFPNAEQYKLKHAIRLNGVVDVWGNRKTVYCIPKDEYVNLEHKERVEYIQDCLNMYKKKHPMKKLKTGNMSYQEFKNNKVQKA